MLSSFSWMNNALAQCQRKLFGRYANIEVMAIDPNRPKPGRRRGQGAAVFNRRLTRTALVSDFNVVTLSRFNVTARHSFGGDGIARTPTRARYSSACSKSVPARS